MSDYCVSCGELLIVTKKVYPCRAGLVCAACKIAAECQAELLRVTNLVIALAFMEMDRRERGNS